MAEDTIGEVDVEFSTVTSYPNLAVRALQTVVVLLLAVVLHAGIVNFATTFVGSVSLGPLACHRAITLDNRPRVVVTLDTGADVRLTGARRGTNLFSRRLTRYGQ